MSYHDDVTALVYAVLNKYKKARGDQLTTAVTNSLPGSIQLHLEGLLEDEAVIREVQWWLIENEQVQISFDDVRRVLGALTSVLKAEEPTQREEASGE